jgi:hypothetical protein
VIDSDLLAAEIVELALDCFGRTPAGAEAAEVALGRMDFDGMGSHSSEPGVGLPLQDRASEGDGNGYDDRREVRKL